MNSVAFSTVFLSTSSVAWTCSKLEFEGMKQNRNSHNRINDDDVLISIEAGFHMFPKDQYAVIVIDIDNVNYDHE